MNDHPETDARPEPAGVRTAPDKGDETPGPSTAAAPAAERTSLFDWLGTLFRNRNGSNLRDDLTDALAGNETEGQSFSPAERAMLHNILRLREVRVEDVMVPRADIQAVEMSTSLGDLLRLFEQSGHSRMPVFVETLDDPRGMVHIRDVLAHITRSAASRKRSPRASRNPAAAVLDLANVDLSRSIAELELIRTVLFVPPSMLASDLMARMQAARTQMALVIDEYGGTDGLASLEDIVEMVVGDIEDEHDEEEALVVEAGEGAYIVDAKAEIDEVARMIGDTFAPGEHGDNVDTIGGLIVNALGRVPARGELVQAVPGFEFHILDADPRRVKRVRIVETRSDRRRRPASKTEDVADEKPAEGEA